ncbi:hypothetical protein PAMP_002823 [Pampus punctatissimus]
MNLFIIEKRGRKLDRKTTCRSIPTVLSRNKRPIVSLPWGSRWWPGKHVAIVTTLSLSPQALSQSGTVQWWLNELFSLRIKDRRP